MPPTRTRELKDVQQFFRLTQRVKQRLTRAARAKGLGEGEFIRLAVLRAIEQTERQGIIVEGTR